LLSLKGTNLEVAQVPLIGVLHDGNVILTKKNNYPQTTTSLVGYYNPVFNFQFQQGSKIPLINVKQILVGEIKQYNNLSEALESAYLFKDIRLNEDTVLELQNGGLTYMVIEVQFANGMSGIYATAFENNHSFGDSKDISYRQALEEKNKEIGRATLNSSKVEIMRGDPFLSVAQSVMCHITLKYGFQVCDETKEGKDIVTGDKSTINTVEKERPQIVSAVPDRNINVTQWKNFTDNDGRFFLEYPAHWVITQSANRFTEGLPLVVTEASNSSAIQAQLSVDVFKTGKSFNNNQLVKYAYNQLVKEVTENKLVEPISCDKYIINSLKACSFVYSGSDKEGNRYGILTVVTVDKDKSNHIISYKTDPLNFDKEQSTMDHIIDSYSLLKNLE
jgi:hypothetical protein